MNIDDILEKLKHLPEDKKNKIIKEAQSFTKNLTWVPNPGPQTIAFNCEADELYFGGAAGGGKSDLAVGLALTQHKRSLILRRLRDDARELARRAIEIVGHDKGFRQDTLEWKLGSRIVEFGGCQIEEDKQRYKGRPHDLIVFDEGADFTESQFQFIKIWNRSTNPKQKCRVVVTSNPPTTAEGLWLIRRWAAWLDPKHPNPAKDGEIRWYLRGADGEEKEVDGPGPYDASGTLVRASSRTFIRSRLEDNPDLNRTDYGSRLFDLPDDLRGAYREGLFEVGLRDQPDQAIPTAWVVEAQNRWTKSPPNIPMTGIAADCSGGGTDPLVISRRHDWWFDELIKVNGKDIPQESIGKFSVGKIVSHRRDGAPVIIDMGGGYGSSTYEILTDNNIRTVPFNGTKATQERTEDRLHGFYNTRSAAIWKFREALDPERVGGANIALPPSQTLLADLTAPTYEIGVRGIQVENKKDVCARLGRSTDEGDSVVMNWYLGNVAPNKRGRSIKVTTKRSRRGK